MGQRVYKSIGEGKARQARRRTQLGAGVTIFPGSASGWLNLVARASSPWCRYSDTPCCPEKWSRPALRRILGVGSCRGSTRRASEKSAERKEKVKCVLVLYDTTYVVCLVWLAVKRVITNAKNRERSVGPPGSRVFGSDPTLLLPGCVPNLKSVLKPTQASSNAEDSNPKSAI